MVRDLETHSNGPNMFRQKRALLADNAALVPGRATGKYGGKVYSGHATSVRVGESRSDGSFKQITGS